MGGLDLRDVLIQVVQEPLSCVGAPGCQWRVGTWEASHDKVTLDDTWALGMVIITLLLFCMDELIGNPKNQHKNMLTPTHLDFIVGVFCWQLASPYRQIASTTLHSFIIEAKGAYGSLQLANLESSKHL